MAANIQATRRKRLARNLLCPTVTDTPKPTKNNDNDWVNIMPEQVAPSPCWDIELALPNGVVLRMMNS